MVDVNLKKINVSGEAWSFPLGIATIEDAISKGHDRRLLRWRVGAAQACGMFTCNLSIAVNPSQPTTFMETAAMYESGVFCGIPYAVDRSLPDGCALLERLDPTPIAQIDGLHVPRMFENR